MISDNSKISAKRRIKEKLLKALVFSAAGIVGIISALLIVKRKPPKLL